MRAFSRTRGGVPHPQLFRGAVHDGQCPAPEPMPPRRQSAHRQLSVIRGCHASRYCAPPARIRPSCTTSLRRDVRQFRELLRGHNVDFWRDARICDPTGIPYEDAEMVGAALTDLFHWPGGQPRKALHVDRKGAAAITPNNDVHRFFVSERQGRCEVEPMESGQDMEFRREIGVVAGHASTLSSKTTEEREAHGSIDKHALGRAHRVCVVHSSERRRTRRRMSARESSIPSFDGATCSRRTKSLRVPNSAITSLSTLNRSSLGSCRW
jgi:hypothetical protein